MEQIQPAYATFEQAEKLKEKNFDVKCKHYYEFALTSKKNKQDGYSGPFGWKKGELNIQSGHFINNDKHVDSSNEAWFLCSRPEQWQIVEWLRVNHGIHIEVSCDVYGELWYAKLHVCSKEVWEDLDKRHNILTAHHKFNEHKSKQEAYSTAFDHILKELI
jgi:hypothetical protein